MLAVAATAEAQSSTEHTLESNPINCWWKTDKTAVQVGERFSLTLTCSVVETQRVTVVPDLNQLDPGAVQLAPFEVLGGKRYEDIKSGLWRYVQYEYSLRLIEDNFFRNDVEIPALTVNYNVQMKQGATTEQGRDHAYVLPTLPIRISSLVPKGARDIRDAPRNSFADIEARSFRATSELAASGVLFCFSLTLFGLALAKVIARWQVRAPVASLRLSNNAVLAACSRELQQLKAQLSGGSWSSEQLARALAAFRAAGAVALSMPVALTVSEAEPRAGQLAVRHGWLRRKRVLISGAVTVRSLSRRIASNGLPQARKQALEEIRDALSALSSASYSREAKVEAAVLNRTLQQGMEAVRRLRLLSLWPRWPMSKGSQAVTPLEDIAWSR